MAASAALAHWLATRRAMALSAAGLAARRERLWGRLQPSLARVPALAPFAGRPLAAFPVVEPAEIRDDHGRWNGLGLTDAALRAAAADAERGGSGEVRPGVVAGFSTGTAGGRGVFLATRAERAAYVGRSLARLMPGWLPFREARVALVLRAGSALYRDANGAGRVRLVHLSLDQPLARRVAALDLVRPDTLIAPAHVLAGLARHAERTGWRLDALRRCLDGAEPMGDGEREWIGQALGVRPAPIYQATEGFLGGACRLGRLHLNDDAMTIELEPVPGTGAFRPVVTDLLRRAQPVVRVRLDDLLEPDPRPCPCGFAGRVVHPVAGRATDLWRFAGRTVTPRAVAAAVEGSLGPRAAWTARATPAEVRLDLDAGLSRPEGEAALAALRALVPVPVRRSGEAPAPDWPKRRRVRWLG